MVAIPCPIRPHCAQCEDGGVDSADAPPEPVVIRISPMAHIAVGFFTLGLLSVVLSYPAYFLPLLVLPVLLSAAIVRYRTVADATTVTARTFLGSRRVDWDDIDGLRFDRGAWALAKRPVGSRGSSASLSDGVGLNSSRRGS